MLFLLVVWIGFIIATAIVAKRKNLNIAGYVIASIFLGPIGLIIVLSELPNRPQMKSPEGLNSLQDAQNELSFIKNSLSSLQKRVINLEQEIKKFAEKGDVVAKLPLEKPISPAEKGIIEAKYEEEGFEFVFGKYWLNRIGVILFFLGVAFFIGFTFKYLNAFSKILIGYIFSVAFFVWGNFLEKRKKYIKISRGILGGAWGLLYLSTYAMYYIRVTRLISSYMLELCLLAAVSLIAIIYNLKYRSWIVTSVTFLLAFITAGLGKMEYSTILYCALLTGAITYISYRLKWYNFLIFGICGNYITYILWLCPQVFKSLLVTRDLSIPVYQFQLNFGILSISWILFTIALFLLNVNDKEKLRYILSGILLNACFFVFLGLAELYRVKPHLEINWNPRFWFLIALACFYLLCAYLYKKLGRERLIVSNVSITFSLLAMAIIVKFPRLSVGFFWILEMVILFIIGVYYRELVYRILAGALSLFIVLRLFIVDYFSNKYYTILGVDINHNVAIFIYCAICFYMVGALVKNKKITKIIMKEEIILFSALIAFGTILVTFILSSEVEAKWLSMSWVLEGIVVLIAGFLLKNKIYRICALCVLSLVCLRLFFVELAGINTIYRIIAFTFLGMIFLGASMVYSKFVVKEGQKG